MRKVILTLVTVTIFVGNHAMAASIFTDDFSGAALGSAWQIVKPGNGSYSLTNGNLRYYNDGFASSPQGWVSTSLTIGVPFTGNKWVLDTKATYHLVYDGTGAQRPQVMVNFDPGNLFNNVAYFDRGTDQWYNYNDLSARYYFNSTSIATAESLLNPVDTISDNIANGTYWYRFIRYGTSLTAEYSYDGDLYTTAFSTELFDSTNNNLLMFTATTYATAGSYTDYEYVNINSLEPNTVPEPSTLILVGIGIGAVTLALRQSTH